jgi:hypothetical protein
MTMFKKYCPAKSNPGQNFAKIYQSYTSSESKEAKYVESWPNTTSAWAGWSRFDIPVDRYGGVHSLLLCTSITLEFSTC